MKTHRLTEKIIATRHHAEIVAATVPDDATVVDFSGVDVIGVSTIDELVERLPGREFVGMNAHMQENYQWVLDARTKLRGDVLPMCVQQWVSNVRGCCEKGGYNTPDHQQPKPCGFYGKADPSGDYEYISRCDVAGCSITSTDGFTDDCNIQDEF